mmetsp:Transcript_23093/g.51522  ORF Transcript_23093/g.51522 Transcript_23093/m.51522 type:complete len:676 (-) Transcript_23093:102-2129(-)
MTSTSRLALGALALVFASVTLDRHLRSSTDHGHDVGLLLEQLEELRTKHEDLHERVLSVTDVDASRRPSRKRRRQQTTSNCTGGFTYAASFGVVGDSLTDDHAALTAALTSAAAVTHGISGDDEGGGGGVVVLPAGTFRINEPLIIPAGVTLQGQGYGSSPLAIQFDAGGSVIAYCGSDHAVKFRGSSASLRDLAVYDIAGRDGTDCPAGTVAAGGILVDAVATTVESLTVSNVFLYFFLGGPAVSLVARDNAGIAFGNYQNVRVRHAKTGIYLKAEEGSFVNSNSFFAGGMSGGGFDSGIWAEGPGPCNDNKFYGMFVEPPDTTHSHVYVTGPKTNIKLHDVRLEATRKDLSRPIVIVDDSSYGNVMNGILGHTHVQANMNRNPGIDLMSQKSVGLDPAPVNLYWNSAFKGWVPASRTLPGWSLVGSNANLDVVADPSQALFPDHNILAVDYLNYGGAFKLMADHFSPAKAEAHDMVTFGVYARSSVAGSIVAAMRYESGSIISSASHSGGGDWEFIGMSALYSKSSPYHYFSIMGDVELAAPTLTFGGAPASPGASLMSSSGARMSGTLVMGLSTYYPPDSNYWVLPKGEGNTFMIDCQGNPGIMLVRLNHRTADRFPRGAIITLVFKEAGTRVKDNAYISLKGDADFVSVPNSSLTLMANGDPTWIEISRNN